MIKGFFKDLCLAIMVVFGVMLFLVFLGLSFGLGFYLAEQIIGGLA